MRNVTLDKIIKISKYNYFAIKINKHNITRNFGYLIN